MTATDEMVRYWNELYCSCPNGERIVEELLGPLKKIQLRRGDFDTAYDSVMSAIGDQDIYFPEAYFGFLNSDIREDVLGLFMNPGAVKHATESWNNEVIRQYTEWEPANYLGECGALTETSPVSKNKKCSCYLNTRHKSGCRWRKDRYDELRTNFGLNDFRFLHSIELFPFHSQKFDEKIKDHLPMMFNLPFMQLTLQTVREISEKKRVRAILGIGKAWEDALDTMTWYSKTTEKFEGSVPTRVIHYQSTENGTPIVILSRQTPNGVKYVIPPAATNYVCSIIGTQTQPAVINTRVLGNVSGRKAARGISKEVEVSDSLQKPISLDSSRSISLIDEVSSLAIHLSGDLDLFVGRTVAPEKARFVYKHLWYPNQKYWNNDSCSIHIHVFRQTEPKIMIRFGFNVNKIEWSEEKILSMKRKLSEIASLLGMEAKMNRAVFAIEREFDHVEKSAECLTALIPKVKLAIGCP